MRAVLSEIEVAPGARITVTVDITPKAKMHVYAPGGDYTPVSVRIEAQPFVKAHDVVYPTAEDFFFAPLNEHARVYSKPFRLLLDLTMGEAGDPKMPGPVTLKGSLDYQACDDQLCYLPASVPLQWTVKIKR